ncbi:MAG TPA: hypothetical protein VJ743_00275 [Albitalea sp.]|nr:hypothetical protein [Albitalea sp.]
MPQALSPDEACRAVNERLRAAVPPGQSLAELQARGIRVRTPLRFPPGTLPAADRASGAAVQGLIAADGSVVPGSPKAIRTIGEPQVADAMEAGALSMNFEFDHSAQPTQPIPFTTTFAVCTRS